MGLGVSKVRNIVIPPTDSWCCIFLRPGLRGYQLLLDTLAMMGMSVFELARVDQIPLLLVSCGTMQTPNPCDFEGHGFRAQTCLLISLLAGSEEQRTYNPATSRTVLNGNHTSLLLPSIHVKQDSSPVASWSFKCYQVVEATEAIHSKLSG